MPDEKRWIWVNGELTPWADARVHLLSQSLQRGTLVFDVMLVHTDVKGPSILGLREHVERFFASAQLNGMQLAVELDDVLEGVAETVRMNAGCELVKLSGYHAGISLDVLPPSERAEVAIAAFARADVGAQHVDTARPSRLQIAASPKMPADVLSPQLKVAAGYTHAAIAKARARAAGFDDVLFLDADENVAESSTHSFFFAIEGDLYTAPLDTVLAGITRRAVIDLAAAEGLAVREALVPATELDRASEAFLTGTSVGIWPVESVGARELGPPVPGPLTRRLQERLARMLGGEDPQFSPRWMQRV